MNKTFRETVWERVNVGDTVLLPRTGKIFEVEIEEAAKDGPHVYVAYKYAINGRRYSHLKFALGEAVYVESRA